MMRTGANDTNRNNLTGGFFAFGKDNTILTAQPKAAPEMHGAGVVIRDENTSVEHDTNMSQPATPYSE
jgi:hypothetical protein